MITIFLNDTLPLKLLKAEYLSEKLFLKKIGLRIKEIRAEKNLSQQELAGLCEFEKSNMSRIEAGNTNPTITILRKISKSLKIELADLLSF